MSNIIKRVLIINLIIAVILSIGISVEAGSTVGNAEQLSFNSNSKYLLQQGENWFYLNLNDLNYSPYDIYVSIKMPYAMERSYAKLLVEGDVDADYTDCVSEYNLVLRNQTDDKCYVYIWLPYSDNNFEAEIFADAFHTTSDNYEPNNWFSKATQLVLDSDNYIKENLGDPIYFGGDIDVYKYTASEPCMLTVKFDSDTEADFGEFDIYIGDTKIASTYRDSYDKRDGVKEIKRGKKFSFNHTHGDCYFKVYDGHGKYTLLIYKENYQIAPSVLLKSPINKQILCEFDSIAPEIGVLGNGSINTYYSCINGETAHESPHVQINANSKSFTNYKFPQLAVGNMPDSDSRAEQHTIQFVAKNTSGAMTASSPQYYFSYDNAPPTYNDVSVEASEDSIEVKVVGANDDIKLAQRPYRYRVYQSNMSPTNYTDWLSNNYYNKGIEFDEINSGADYTVDVQIRDAVGEKYQSNNNDLSNHIVTITKTVHID